MLTHGRNIQQTFTIKSVLQNFVSCSHQKNLDTLSGSEVILGWRSSKILPSSLLVKDETRDGQVDLVCVFTVMSFLLQCVVLKRKTLNLMVHLPSHVLWITTKRAGSVFGDLFPSVKLSEIWSRQMYEFPFVEKKRLQSKMNSINLGCSPCQKENMAV